MPLPFISHKSCKHRLPIGFLYTVILLLWLGRVSSSHSLSTVLFSLPLFLSNFKILRGYLRLTYFCLVYSQPVQTHHLQKLPTCFRIDFRSSDPMLILSQFIVRPGYPLHRISPNAPHVCILFKEKFHSGELQQEISNLLRILMRFNTES